MAMPYVILAKLTEVCRPRVWLWSARDTRGQHTPTLQHLISAPPSYLTGPRLRRELRGAAAARARDSRIGSQKRGLVGKLCAASRDGRLVQRLDVTIGIRPGLRLLPCPVIRGDIYMGQREHPPGYVAGPCRTVNN